MMYLVSIKYIKQREMTSCDLFCLKSSVLQKENTENLLWNKKKAFLSPLRQHVQSEHQRRRLKKEEKDSMNSTNLKMFSNTLV